MSRIRPWYLAIATATTLAVAAPSLAIADTAPGTTNRCEGLLQLDRGHVDIQATLSGDTMGIHLKDETTAQRVDRRLDEVMLVAGDNAKVTRSAGLMQPELNVLGDQGSEFYLLPMTQNQSIIWPGHNTMGLDYAHIDGTVDLHLEPRTRPEGGELAMFLSSLTGVDVLLNTAESDTTIETTYAAHVHTNWAFTKPGLYTFDTYYSATSKAGKALKSEPQTLTVAVGAKGLADCTVVEQPTTTAPTTAPTTTPATTPAPNSSSSGVESWQIVAGIVGSVTALGLGKFFIDNRTNLAAWFRSFA